MKGCKAGVSCQRNCHCLVQLKTRMRKWLRKQMPEFYSQWMVRLLTENIEREERRKLGN